MSNAQANGFLGWLLRQSKGVAPRQSSRTEAKYRRWQRDLGLTIAED